MITPNTDLYLLKVPLEINNLNQLTFANKTAQFNYFNSLPKVEAENFTYQRKDGTVRFEGKYDELVTYNYCMYRNNEYSDKWFYAYIVDMEYVNDNMTMIQLKSDTWQCWQFDLTFKPVLIDREHVNDDTIGANILEEGLELGEFVTNGNVTNFNNSSDTCIVIEVSQIENTGESSTLSYSWASGSHDATPDLNGISRGTVPLVLNIIEGSFATPDNVRRVYDMAGLGDSIINIYMLPKDLIGTCNEISITARVDDGMGGFSSLSVTGLGVPESFSGVYNLGTTTLTRPSSIDGFIPKNQKMYTFPYCYFNVSNNAGTSLPYHYEDFSNQNIQFKIEGTFGVSGCVKAIPIDYKNISSTENALDYSISGAKYPVCSWKSDSYTNWLTQNAVNMQTQWKTTLLRTGLNIASGGLSAGMDASEIPKATASQIFKTSLVGAGIPAIQAVGDIVSLAREQHLAKTQANMMPDQVHGNLNAGDFVWAKYRSPFTFLPMSIKASIARCIDEFFSQYGYKCNRVKVPNITGRRNWNYVKTVGCYIEADIPQGDLAEIRGMFDNGITLWHNPATFADYSQNNDIIG